MNQDIKKLQEERQRIAQQVEALDKQKNQLVTRLVELQGIINYLQEKEVENQRTTKGR